MEEAAKDNGSNRLCESHKKSLTYTRKINLREKFMLSTFM